MRDTIDMAREAGLEQDGDNFFSPMHDEMDVHIADLKRFEALVRADEREKTLRLWMLLDDVDTADDIAKADDAIYRSLCRQAHAKRWDVLTGDEVDSTIRARGNT